MLVKTFRKFDRMLKKFSERFDVLIYLVIKFRNWSDIRLTIH